MSLPPEDDFEIDDTWLTFYNVTVMGDGITTTLIMLLIVCTLVVIFSVVCCHRLAPYNIGKKRRLWQSWMELERIRARSEAPKRSAFASHADIEHVSHHNWFLRKSIANLLRRIIAYAKQLFMFVILMIATLIIPSCRRKDHQHLTRKLGRQIAAYVMFEQMLIWVTVICTALAIAILLPIHLLGNGDGVRNDLLMRTTASMVLTDPWMNVAHLVLSAIFVLVPLIGITMFASHKINRTYNYMRRDEESDFNRDFIPSPFPIHSNSFDIERNLHSLQEISASQEDQLTILLSPFTVVVSGLPSEFISARAFRSLAETVVEDPAAIVKTELIYDVSKRLALQKQLHHWKDRLEHVEYTRETTGIHSKKLLCFTRYNDDGTEGFHLVRRVNASTYIRRRMAELEYRIKKWDDRYKEILELVPIVLAQHEEEPDGRTYIKMAVDTHATTKDSSTLYDIHCSGVGYITFNSIASARKCARHLKRTGYKVLYRREERTAEADPSFLVEGQERTERYLRTMIYLQRSNEHTTLNVNTPCLGVLKLGAALRKQKRGGNAVALLRGSVSKIEPSDLRWNSIFQTHRTSWWFSFARHCAIYFVIIVFLTASTTPTVIGTVIDQILGVSPELSDSVSFIFRMGGPIGGLLFHSLPTIILAATVFLVPRLIKWITERTPYSSHGKTGRHVLTRSYAFLTLAMLIVPTVILAIASAYIEHETIQQEGVTMEMFQHVFIYSTAVFWINLLLQKTFLKNTFNMLDPMRALIYIVRRRFGLRIMSPRERIKAAESASGYFYPSKEYAYLLSVQGMTFCIGIQSPLLFVVGLAFMLTKYLVDRYRIWYTYEHMSDHITYGNEDAPERLPFSRLGKTAGLTVDFLSHIRIIHLICRIFIFNTLLSLAYMLFYFIIKMWISTDFVIHVAITGAMFLLVAIALGFFYVFSEGVIQFCVRRPVAVAKNEKELLHTNNPNVARAYRIPHPAIRELHKKSLPMNCV